MLRTGRVVLAAGLVLASAAGIVHAADRPVAGDRLSLKDPSNNANGRAVRFKAARDPSIVPSTGADPTVVGATLEVMGENPGDGSTGPITLPAGLWTGLGNPAGSKGYKFKDLARADGIKTVTLKPGNNGGLLSIVGGGPDWAYSITQSQGAIDVRLTVGPDVYCARFSTFVSNVTGRVAAKLATAPADCSIPTGPTCGDGTVQGTEECDDGDTDSGDGCSATCQLENASALCAGVPSTPGENLDSVLVQGGLNRPIFLTSAPLDPNRLFVVLQDGTIRIIKNGVLLPTPFLDIEDIVSCCGERGLFSMAFAPDYDTSGVFYVSYTNNDGDEEVSRYTVSGNPDIANEPGTPILTIEDFASNHNGGHIAFGPDGYLYHGVGDGGGGGDPNETGQDIEELLGKMLRIDVNAPTYTNPPSNPFVGIAGRDEIWAYGLRNPWRWSFDRANGDLYIADVGQNTWEEVNYRPAASPGGENYGWDIFEANACFEPEPPAEDCPMPPTGFTFPVVTYNHGQGCSVTGGYVYRGCALPDLAGTYFYSDICTPFIRTFEISGGAAVNLQNRTADLAPSGGGSIGGVSSFGEDARGEMYVIDYGGGSNGQGEIYRIVPQS